MVLLGVAFLGLGVCGGGMVWEMSVLQREMEGFLRCCRWEGSRGL
jgi:hypothetical protein